MFFYVFMHSLNMVIQDDDIFSNAFNINCLPPDFLLRWLSDKRPSQTDPPLLLCHLIWPLVTAFFVEPRYYINCFFLHMICIKMKWEEYDRLSLIGMLAFLSSTGQLEEPLDVQSGFEKSRFDKFNFLKVYQPEHHSYRRHHRDCGNHK